MNVLDLFAGPGGWDEGVRPLGLHPLGVELDEAACATGRAAGHRRLHADVAALDPRGVAEEHFDGPVVGLIASPPCQGFSTAGKGKGRVDSVLMLEALGYVRTLADLEAALAWLHGQMTDDRSLLALEPLRWALALEPEWLTWEQVPAVLPLWEASAEVLRRNGYSVAVGKLHAEQYGVPQTRQRAILAGRRAPWQAELPTPTHSRYYPRTPSRLDPGLKPWVSMAEALSWGMTHRPYVTIAAGTASGGQDPQMLGGTGARKTVRREIDEGRWVARSNYGTSGDPANRGERELHQPASTVTSKVGRNKWAMHSAGRTAPETAGQVPRELESPSATITGKGTAAWVVSTGVNTATVGPGEERDAAMREGRWRDIHKPQERSVHAPAPTVDGKAPGAWAVHPAGEREEALAAHREGREPVWAMRASVSDTGSNKGRARRDTEPAATITGKVRSAEWVEPTEENGQSRRGPAAGEPEPEWAYSSGTHDKRAVRSVDLPAPTVMFGAKLNTVEWQLATGTRGEATIRDESSPAPTFAFGKDAASHVWVPAGLRAEDIATAKADGTAVRVTVEEAAVLQTFPADYPWQGTKTARYRQVGDAVPPLLARAIVEAVIGQGPGWLR